MATNYELWTLVTSGGSANAQTVTVSGPLPAITTGFYLKFVAGPGLTNTGNCTLAVNGFAAESIKAGSANLDGGEIQEGDVVDVVFDGSNFQLLQTSRFTADGTGAQSRSVANKLFDFVSVLDFGADATGASDSTTAIQAAIDTGRTVYLPAGTYTLTSGLTLSTVGQRLLGEGLTLATLKASGSFDIVTIDQTGSPGAAFGGGGVENLRINATGATSGFAIVVNNSTRIVLENIHVANGYNGIRLAGIQGVCISNTSCENTTGDVILFCDGTTSHSTSLRLIGINFSGDGTSGAPDGIVVDGDFNTIQGFAVNILSVQHAIWFKNTNAGSGTPNPQFFRCFDFEGDFSNLLEQVRIDYGKEIHFSDAWLHGSQQADGVYIASGVDVVSFTGGTISGNYMHGVANYGSRVKLTAVHIAGNSAAGAGMYSAVYCGSTATFFTSSDCNTGLNTSTVKKQKYGFEVAAGATDCNWLGGSLRDNFTGEWLDNSGGGYGNVNVIAYSGDTPWSNEAYLATVPGSGFSITIANGQPTLILVPGANISGTVTMPAAPRDGMQVNISCNSHSINPITIQGNTGQTIHNAPTSLTPGQGCGFIWRASTANWYRLY